jgi:hypothetical protein
MNSPSYWQRIRQARNALASQLLGHPAVSMVDIGLAEPRPGASAVLRVHLRTHTNTDLHIPTSIDGFDVQVIYAEYRPETKGTTP